MYTLNILTLVDYLAFALDSSNKVQPSEYELAKKSLASLVSSIRLGCTSLDARYALVRFGKSSNTAFWNLRNSVLVEDKILALEHPGRFQGRDTGLAISQALETIIEEINPGEKRTIIALTFGETEDKEWMLAQERAVVNAGMLCNACDTCLLRVY